MRRYCWLLLIPFFVAPAIYAISIREYVVLFNEKVLNSCFSNKYQISPTNMDDMKTQVKNFITSDSDTFAYRVKFRPQEWVMLDEILNKDIKDINVYYDLLNFSLKSKDDKKVYSVLGVNKNAADDLLKSHFEITRTLTDPQERGKRFNIILRLFAIILAKKANVDWITSIPVEGAISKKINESLNFNAITSPSKTVYYLNLKDAVNDYITTHMRPFCANINYTAKEFEAMCYDCVRLSVSEIMDL